MTEQAREPSEDNRMAALQLIARQSVTRLAEILDSKDEAIETARKERDEARAEAERLRMACGMAYGIPGAEKIEVDAMRPVEKMQEIVAAVAAEVERLRPAAEAWEATEAWRAVGMHIENRRGRDDAYQAMDRAAARARAAKEKGA